MNAAETVGLLDAHDALVGACLNGNLSLAEFVAAYADFPDGCGLGEDATVDTRTILPLFGKRIAFHRRVAGVVAGYRQTPANAVPDDLRGFLESGIMHRLRDLITRYPDFKSLP